MTVMHERMDAKLLEEGADWSLIRAFIEVVRARTLSAAARNLGATQPTLGRQMRRLESLYGEPLFRRRGRELAPTDRAMTLYEAAVGIETEVTALTRAFAAGARGRGVVRITASEIVAVRLLPPLLAPILAADPGLEIELLSSDRMDNLVRRDADIAVRMSRPVQAELIAVKIGDTPFGLYATRGLVEKYGRPRQLADLASWPWVSGRDGREVIEVAQEHQLHIDPANLRLRSDSTVVRMQAVEAGLGAGAVSVALAEQSEVLERLLPAFSPFSMPMWLVANDDLNRSTRHRYVFDALRTGLREALARHSAAAARSQEEAA